MEEEKKEMVAFRGVSRDEEGRKRVEIVEVADTQQPEKLKYIENKLINKGVHRKDRHPVDGRPLRQQAKSGHGGKFTWEGPAAEEEEAPAVLDENDPNYVDDEEEVDVKLHRSLQPNV